MLKEFKEFIDKGNIVGLAVGLILALAFVPVVQSLVDDIILPIVAAIFGEPNFDDLTFDIGDGIVSYGRFITAVVSFLLIAFAVFMMVKLYNKATRKKEEEDGPTELDVLKEIRDKIAR